MEVNLKYHFNIQYTTAKYIRIRVSRIVQILEPYIFVLEL